MTDRRPARKGEAEAEGRPSPTNGPGSPPSPKLRRVSPAPPDSPLPVGKLDFPLLADLLARYRRDDPRVLVGPAPGEDAAVIDMGDRLLVVKSDPITFATDEIGYYAVHVNANDVAIRGARPRWFLATLLLPEGSTTPELVDAIFHQVHSACETLGIAVVGGHTEITHGLPRPILSGHMLGEVDRDRLITTAGLRPGDRVLAARGIPIEGGAILGREKSAELLARGMTEREVAALRGLLHEPGISVVEAALTAAEAGGVTSMHDPTEGGICTGLLEMAAASGVGLRIHRERLPLFSLVVRACELLGLDPLGTIASGCLLIGADPDAAPEILDALRAGGVRAEEVGYVVESAQGCAFVPGLRGQTGMSAPPEPIPWFHQDEIAKVF